MIVCKIKGKHKLTERERRYLSDTFKNLVFANSLEYVLVFDSKDPAENNDKVLP